MAVVLVSHDLGVISETCDDVVVMYAGKVLEAGHGPAVMRSPRHPYTDGLIKAMPSLEVTDEPATAPIPGQPPNLADLPPGCPFSPSLPVQPPGVRLRPGACSTPISKDMAPPARSSGAEA